MSATMNRGLVLSLLVGLVIMIAMAFSQPVVSYATTTTTTTTEEKITNDPNQVDVTFDSEGNLTVSGGGFDDAGSSKAWEDFIKKYRNFITGIAGIGAVTMVVLFIVQFMKLGASAGNPQARSQALVGVLWTGIAAAGLGAVTLIVGFFYNAV